MFDKYYHVEFFRSHCSGQCEIHTFGKNLFCPLRPKSEKLVPYIPTYDYSIVVIEDRQKKEVAQVL